MQTGAQIVNGTHSLSVASNVYCLGRILKCVAVRSALKLLGEKSVKEEPDKWPSIREICDEPQNLS